jgi:hypothetical protein
MILVVVDDSAREAVVSDLGKDHQLLLTVIVEAAWRRIAQQT